MLLRRAPVGKSTFRGAAAAAFAQAAAPAVSVVVSVVSRHLLEPCCHEAPTIPFLIVCCERLAYGALSIPCKHGGDSSHVLVPDF